MKRNLFIVIIAMVAIVTCAAFVAQSNQDKSGLRAAAKNPGDKLYSTVTLAAFNTAKQLRTRYDSVVWFAHVDKSKSFFYVINGKWQQYGNARPVSVASNKVHTVSAKTDKIIPVSDVIFTRVENDTGLDKAAGKPSYQMGLVSPELKEIIPPQYDMVYNISGTVDNLVEVEKNNKKGLYDLSGKIIVAVSYDAIYPLTDGDNLAVLKKGDAYFYLKKNLQLSGKVKLKLGDFFANVKYASTGFIADSSFIKVVTELNSKNDDRAIFISPSYMVGLNLFPVFQRYSNPLRNTVSFYKNRAFKVTNTGKATTEKQSRLEAFFYSLENNFLGGRVMFYNKQSVVVVDKKNDKVATFDLRGNFNRFPNQQLSSNCSINAVRPINNSLIELKVGESDLVKLYTGAMVNIATSYKYFVLKNNTWQLAQKEAGSRGRKFSFTKYVRMDDSYLDWCFDESTSKKEKALTHDQLMTQVLLYMKNEIYADYDYIFKDKHWNELFYPPYQYNPNGEKYVPKNANVDGLLTATDRYNISFINQKLKGLDQQPDLAAQ